MCCFIQYIVLYASFCAPYTITLTAYPEKKLTICREGDHFVCHVKIDNRQAILQSLYVKASPNNPLNVEYVELQGITTDTGVPVTEKVSK